MTYSFHEEAEQELIVATANYEKLQEGLGVAFSQKVFDTIDLILSFPKAWPVLDEGDRRVLLNTFPFSIVYTINEDKTSA